jgi:hypothetical protein
MVSIWLLGTVIPVSLGRHSYMEAVEYLRRFRDTEQVQFFGDEYHPLFTGNLAESFEWLSTQTARLIERGLRPVGMV